MVITYKKCTFCGQDVELNGSGSTSNIWQRGLTSLINFLYPISQKLSRKASDQHDLAYHVGLIGGREKADDNFLNTFLECVEKPELLNEYVALERSLGNDLPKLNWLDMGLIKSNRWWFRWQARKYHKALQIGGASVYPRRPCTCETRN